MSIPFERCAILQGVSRGIATVLWMLAALVQVESNLFGDIATGFWVLAVLVLVKERLLRKRLLASEGTTKDVTREVVPTIV